MPVSRAHCQVAALERSLEAERGARLTSEAQAQQSASTLQSFRTRRDEDLGSLTDTLRQERRALTEKTIEADRLRSQLQAELRAREDSQAEVDRLFKEMNADRQAHNAKASELQKEVTEARQALAREQDERSRVVSALEVLDQQLAAAREEGAAYVTSAVLAVLAPSTH